MYRFVPLLAIAALIGSCTCDKCPGQGFDPNKPMIGDHDYNAGRVPDMPSNPEQKYYLSLCTHDPGYMTQAEANVKGWFEKDTRLKDMRAKTNFNWYTASNPHYKERLAKRWGNAFPIVCLTDASGKIIAHVTAKSMPKTGGELADMLVRGVEAFNPPKKFDWQVEGFTPIVNQNGAPCPGPDCNPPSQTPDDSSDVVDEVIPPKPMDNATYAIGAAVVAFSVVGAGYALRNKSQPSDRFI